MRRTGDGIPRERRRDDEGVPSVYPGAAEGLAAAPASVTGPDRLARVGGWIIECATASELHARVRGDNGVGRLRRLWRGPARGAASASNGRPIARRRRLRRHLLTLDVHPGAASSASSRLGASTSPARGFRGKGIEIVVSLPRRPGRRRWRGPCRGSGSKQGRSLSRWNRTRGPRGGHTRSSSGTSRAVARLLSAFSDPGFTPRSMAER